MPDWPMSAGLNRNYAVHWRAGARFLALARCPPQAIFENSFGFKWSESHHHHHHPHKHHLSPSLSPPLVARETLADLSICPRRQSARPAIYFAPLPSSASDEITISPQYLFFFPFSPPQKSPDMFARSGLRSTRAFANANIAKVSIIHCPGRRAGLGARSCQYLCS